MEAIPLSSFPAGDNPFWHDLTSCGMDLRQATTNEKLRGVFVMSSGFSSEFDFYIVNKTDGSRIGIKL